MPAGFVFGIDAYTIDYGATGGRPYVDLYLYSKGTCVGEFHFYQYPPGLDLNDTDNIPNNLFNTVWTTALDKPKGYFRAHLPIERFSDIHTLLRSEKPLQAVVRVNDKMPEALKVVVMISTGEKEPVGEMMEKA